VNGVWLQQQYVSDPQQPVNQFVAQFTKLHFAQGGERHFHLEVHDTYLFGGLVLLPQGNLMASAVLRQLKAVFFGDSYTIPAGPVLSVGYFAYVGDYFNWNWVNEPAGGTGYLAGGTWNKTFGQRISEIVSQNPDIVVVYGGGNDPSTPEPLQAAVDSFYSALRAALPQATVFVIGPQSVSGAQNVSKLPERDAIKNGSAPYNVHFIDPLAEQWITGTYNVANSGDAPEYISTDGTHLTQAGNSYVASMMIRDMSPVFSGQPQITSQGVVNAASFASVLVPGELATVFGTSLHPSGVVSASETPLPIQLDNVAVAVNGIIVPLLYLDNGQINFQVPYGIPAETAVLSVSTGGVASNSVEVPVASAAPGIFVYNSTFAVVQNQDYSLNGPGNPAKAGSYITIYATGGGELDNAVPAGTPAPEAPLSHTVQRATVTIGGVAAGVLFSGLTPGFVGLLQINAQVPQLGAGTYPVQVTIGNSPSNTPNIVVSP